MCKQLDVICVSEIEIGHCSVTNLNQIDEELNFKTSNNSFRKSITQIIFKKSSLKNLPSAILNAYSNLKELSMNDCKIKQIEDNTFIHATNLRNLELSDNRIRQLTNSTFFGAENLEK